MINNKKSLFSSMYFLIFCLCFSIVFADSTYENYGGDDGLFASVTDTDFNEGNDDAGFVSTEYTPNALKMPLVSDLNGDGVKEIIVFSKTDVYLYNASMYQGVIDLNSITSFSTGNTGTERDFFSNVILFDIDGDGNKEIIFNSQQSGNIFMLGFNDTHLVNESSLSLQFNYNAGDPIISSNTQIICGDTYDSDNKCLLIGNDQSSYSAIGSRTLTSYVFNYTHLNLNHYTRIRDGGFNPHCFNRENSLVYANGFYYLVTGTNQNFYLVTMDMNETHGEIIRDTGTGGFNNYGASGCGRFWGGDNFYSSPLAFDLGMGDPKEIMVGFNTGFDNYKLKIFSYDGFSVDTLPSVDAGNGNIISNPFLANTYTDTGLEDVCILGYVSASSEVDSTCISLSTDMLGILSAVQYSFTDEDIILTPNNTNVFGFGVHSIESKQNGVSEFLTSYGVLELEIFGQGNYYCEIFGDCGLFGYIHEFNLNEPSSVIPIDYFDEGKDDLLFLTENNLKYYDDGFINSNAYLEYCTEIEPNPDRDYQLHINTNIVNGTNITNEVRVTTKANDLNGDPVSSMIVLYYGEINAQFSGWSPNTTNGAEYTHKGLLPNETTSNSILRIYYRDTENYFNDPNYIDFNFVVANEGDFRGDSSLCVGDTEEEAFNKSKGEIDISLNESCVKDSDCLGDLVCFKNHCAEPVTMEDNVITDSVRDISFLVGIPVLILILLLFGIVTYAVFKEPRIPNNIKLPVIIILSLFGFGISIYLGLLSVMWLVLLVLLIIIVLAVFIIRFVGR